MTREAARGEIRYALLGFANAFSRDRRDTSPSAVRLMATTQLRRALLCCLLFQRSHALSSATSPWSAFTAFNADAAWRGYAYAVDPATAVPKLPGIEYSHFVALDDSKKAAVRTTTTVGKDASADVVSVPENNMGAHATQDEDDHARRDHRGKHELWKGGWVE